MFFLLYAIRCVQCTFGLLTSLCKLPVMTSLCLELDHVKVLLFQLAGMLCVCVFFFILFHLVIDQNVDLY